MDHPSPISRLGTPMSSQCEGRRPSLGWSFMAGSSSYPSHPSSIASFQSSHEPHTPPPHVIPMEFTINPNGSFENFSIPTQGKPVFHESQMVETSVLNGEFEDQPESDWVYMYRSTENTMHRMPFYANEPMLQTQGDYNATLGAGIQADQQTLVSHSYLSPWNLQQPETTYPAAEPFEWQQSMRPLTPTIVPSDVVRDRQILNQESQLHDYHECHSEMHSPRDYYALSQDNVESHYKSESSLSEQGDETWTPGSGMMTPKIGAEKGRRSSTKDRRSASGKRTSRVIKSTMDWKSRLNNRDVDVQYQHPRNSKKHMCRFLLENGQVCSSGFERVEHLRRHEQIHQPTRPFTCPLHLRPEYKCHKLFGRRDNWRDHLRTHISNTIAGRNDRTTFEILFKLLRESEEPEEAEKTINMLLKWKAKGGHEKSTSLPVRGTGGM